MIVLIALFAVAGVGYVLLSGPANNAKSIQKPAPPPSPDAGVPKPPNPSPTAAEQASVEVLTSPVSAGSNSSITVKTNPSSTCTISVVYNNVPSKDSGLAPKATDAYGNVTWTWTVDKTAPVGTWPVTVTCVYSKNKKSAVTVGNLQVTK